MRPSGTPTVLRKTGATLGYVENVNKDPRCHGGTSNGDAVRLRPNGERKLIINFKSINDVTCHPLLPYGNLGIQVPLLPFFVPHLE